MDLFKIKNSFSQSYLDTKLVKSILKRHFDKKCDYSTLIWMMYSLEKCDKIFLINDLIEITI